jgi:signal transduction histidine kinase
MSTESQKVFALNLLFLVITGQLVNLLAEAIRAQSAKYKAVAEQLSFANQQLSEAEAAVRRSERLAALGQLTAGLAHELRNPLGTIKASAEMISRSVTAENEIAREVAGYITTEVDRCNSLVSRFLDFARPLEPRLAPADLAQVIDRAIEMVGREASDRQIAIYRNFEPNIPSFPMDSELMERVFFNLLQNAVQASPPGNSVTVKTRSVGEFAEASVIDRGSGIDAKHIETIFNPFFTTKASGVGLGLAVVSRIVDGHGGKMAVESRPGEGSVFHVCLPLRNPAPKNRE